MSSTKCVHQCSMYMYMPVHCNNNNNYYIMYNYILAYMYFVHSMQAMP